MLRLRPTLLSTLVLITVSIPVAASEYEQIERELAAREWLDRIGGEAHRQAAIILPTDRDPCDVLLRRTQALLEHLTTLEGARDFTEQQKQLKSLQRSVELTPIEEKDRRRSVFGRLQNLRRTIAMMNPLLNFDDIIFIGRVMPATRHMCPQYYGFTHRPGGSVYVLEDAFSDSPQIRDLFEGKTITSGRTKGKSLSSGSGVALELDWDAKQIYFAWSETESGKPLALDRSKWHSTYPCGYSFTGREECHWSPESALHIYRADIEGDNLVQMTDGPWNEFDPCVLPSGRIMFASERRGGYGRCHGIPFPTSTLYGMMADGSDIIPLSYHETNEWAPSLTHDGQVVFTRWDYVDRDADIAHHLWLCYPDGRDPRSPHGNYPENSPRVRPTMEMSIRAIPGSHKFVAVAAPHHGLYFGSLVLIDLRVPDDRARSQIRRLTPETPFAEAEATWMTYNYGTPWPLSEDFYLCAYTESTDGHYGMDTRHELYLIDSFGNRIRLAGLPDQLSVVDPIPLRPRKRPPVIPIQTQQAAVDLPEGETPREATITVMNIYESELPWPADTRIDALRVIQVYPKTTPDRNEPKIGCASQTLARGVLGTAKVETDGSCRFVAPVGVPIYLQALDADGRAVQSMRSATFVHRGEQLTCIGCHEDKHKPVQLKGQPIALSKPVQQLKPELPDAARPLTFPRLVQPVLDRHCVECHEKEEKAASLAGDRFGEFGWSEGYWGLVPYTWVQHGNPVKTTKLREIFGPGDGWMLNGRSYSVPGQVGARASKLLPLLERGHHDVKLSPDQMHRITLWLDCNSVYYGAYYDIERQASGERVLPDLE